MKLLDQSEGKGQCTTPAKWGVASSLCRRLSGAIVAVWMVATVGCGQVMIRQDVCGPNSMRIAEVEADCDSNGLPPMGCVGDRLEIMKAKLGWQGERLKGGLDRCSDKLSECWYSSKVAQWAQKHRENANAPPNPKFHPIPTHPAFFPENCDQNASASIQSVPQESPVIVEE